MANRPAPALVLRDGDREELERWARSATVAASAAKRARIVLLAADGVANSRVAELTDTSANTVLVWRASGIKPWKAESFRFSTDICGLYLHQRMRRAVRR